MSNVAAEIFRQAARLNAEDSRRRGNVVFLDAGRQVMVTGDIHGHRKNLSRIISCANLTAEGPTVLVFQEIIHGPIDPQTQHDRSIELLLRAARLKVAHPQAVLFVIGNHDIAQVTGNEITKNGRGVCKAFAAGVDFAFGPAGSEVLAAVKEFILSMPLAVRCPNGVLITHSLPSPQRTALAGTDIFHRPYQKTDLARGGALYEWTWGRGQTAEQIAALAGQMQVEVFVLGHRRVEEGYEIIPPQTIVLASDHDHGYVIRFATDAPLTVEAAGEHLTPIVSLGVAGR